MKILVIYFSFQKIQKPQVAPLLAHAMYRCIGSRNATRQTLPTSAKLTYRSVYVHRCIGSRNETRQTLPTSTKLMYLSVHDRRDGVSGLGVSPSTPSSLTHVYRCIVSRNATRQTLPTSAKLTSLSMHDSRNGTTQCMGDV
jgi:hypothetical protein